MLEAQRWLFRGLMGITVIAIGAQLVGLVRTFGDDRGDRAPIIVTQIKTIEVPVEKPPAPAAVEDCQPIDEDKPMAAWTIGETHFGPFTSCATIDRAFVERAMPGYEIEETTEMGLVPKLVVQKHGRPVLSIVPKYTGGQLSVTAYDRAIETPSRVRVGDRLRVLRAHNKDIYCVYGALEGDEGLWCQRSGMGGGFTDTFKYSLDMKPLGKDRTLFETDYENKLGRLDHLAIESISWSAR